METFFKRPWIIIAVVLLITVFFAAYLPRVDLDNNNLRFVPFDDPALETSRWIDSTFGSSLFILVGLRRDHGTVFDSGLLNKLRDYVEEVKTFSIVKDVVSLVSADYITSIDGAIVVEPLVSGDFSGTAPEITELKRRLLSWDLYERALISDDFSATQILIPLTISQEDAGLSETSAKFLEIRDLAHKKFDGLCSVYVTGMPVIVAAVNEEMNADLKLLIPLVVVVVLTVLFFSFRKLSRVILPLLTVVIAVIWAVGAVPLLGFKLSVISTVLPVILVAVGSAYGIHVVTHYITDRPPALPDKEAHRLFVIEVLRKILKPVFLAALTTFAGFISLCFTSVAPIREFGGFASFGVLAAFIVAVTFIPALLIIRGPEKKKENEKEDVYSTVVANTLMNIAGKKRTVLSLAALTVLVSVYGLTKIISDNAMIEYFKPDTEVFKSDQFIRENFGGSKTINAVLHGEDPELILHPATLSAMDGLAAYLEKNPNVGKLMGFTDMVKRINQVLNANSPPEGLERTEEDTSAFDDFGFGNWDFEESAANDASEAGEVGEASAKTSAPEQPNPQEKVLTQGDFFALLDKASAVSRALSANDLAREMKKQVNYEGAAYYEIPADPARYGKDTPEDLQRLVSNYLVLLSGGISSYANNSLEPTAIKTTIQLRTLGMDDSRKIVNAIEDYFKDIVPQGVKVTIGGSTMVEGSLNSLIVRTQVISVIISILCIFIIVAFSNRSVIAGIVGVLPLSISILVNFAVMGFAGIKLNLGTSMVASVSVGIGIDYSIHFLEAFKREYRKYKGGADFLMACFKSSGKAIIINAVSVGAGFAVLLLSRFNILCDLGLLIAITMCTSALVSLTVLPALLVVLKPKFITKQE